MPKHSMLWALLAASSICWTLPASGQDAPPISDVPTLIVQGDVTTPLALQPADLAAMPRASVSASVAGVETRYEGVWMHEILRSAGAPLGEELRGPALATYVLATGQDGYQVVYSLGELDPALEDNQILIADRANGQPLTGDDGAFRIIAPLESRGSRWVRMLATIDVVRLRL
jgi:hypothetical protein